jgi:arsenate reductase (thioredoxin)
VPDRPFNVLFLCTGNSARSIIAEAILYKLGPGKFHAYSAGSQPKGQVNPHTVQLLESLGYDTSGFRSKSWSEFAKLGAPPLDFVFTVCDNAAGEACPVWPGQPMTAHWGVPDPAEAKGSPAEIALAFKDAYQMLFQRIGVFTALPIRSLDHLSLQSKLRDDLGLRSAYTYGRTLRGRALHHLGLLVHSLYILCQSGSDHCTIDFRHVRRHRSLSGTGLYFCPAWRNALGSDAGSMAWARVMSG